MNDYEQQTLLETCLDAILTDRQTLEQCLAQYPDEADWLKTALQAALLTARLEPPAMGADRVAALESRLLAHYDEQVIPRQASVPETHRRTGGRILQFPQTAMGKAAAAVVLVFLLTLGTGGGTVAAAASATPDDTLYAVKRAWEDFIAMLATLIGEADDVWLHLAQERLNDLEYLRERDQLTDTSLMDFYTALEKAILNASDTTGTDLVTLMLRTSDSLTASPPPAQALQDEYDRVLVLLEPRFDNQGNLTLPAAPPLTPEPSVVEATATMPVTNTPVMATETMVLTLTATLTPTDLPATSTPRLPATATRTPTPAPTETATLTATLEPTLTWTPLASPQGIASRTPVVPTAINIQPEPQATATISDGGGPIFIRATERAVFATQTAIAEDNFGTPQP